MGRVSEAKTLSARDLEIVRLISLGHDTLSIAEELDVSRWNIRDRVRKMCRMFDCPMRDLPRAVAARKR